MKFGLLHIWMEQTGLWNATWRWDDYYVTRTSVGAMRAVLLSCLACVFYRIKNLNEY